MRLLAALALAWSCLFADAAVLVYHRFDDVRFPSTSIGTEKLREDFQWLRDNGYNVVPLSEIVQSVKTSQPIAPKTVALSIDDGYKSFYESGLAVFREFDYPFTLFVYVEATENGYADFMSWEQLHEITAFGSVELHTYSHAHLTHLDDAALEHELTQAVSIFENRMGYRPRLVAYPFGEYDRTVREAHEKLGFDALFNYNGGMIGHQSDVFNLDRVGVTGKWPVKTLVDRRMLAVQWGEDPVVDGQIGTIRAQVLKPGLKQVILVVTGYPDRWVELHEGRLEVAFEQPVKNSRTLIALKDGKGGIATRLIMKKE